MAAAVAEDIDVVINSSGQVTFNPPLESALRTNVEGTKNVIAFAKRMQRPALVHTSTCFVAGNRSGEVWEDEPLDRLLPALARAARHRLLGRAGDRRQRAHRRSRCAAQADDAQVLARLREQARARLHEEGRDPDDEEALKLAVARERKDWIRPELTELGMERAADWGWPNIYTYTKSIGDQLVAARDRHRPVDRPAGDRRERAALSRSRAGTRASPPRRRWSTWRSRARTCCRSPSR